MKQLYIAIVFMAITIVASAQNCSNTLTGKVIDFHDGSPLFGALVQVIGTDVEAYSDFDGNFTIPQLCSGSIELQVSHPECESVVQTVTIKGDTHQEIKLEHHLQELGEIVVAENRNTTKTNSGNENQVDAKAIEQYSSSNLGTALKTVSGVSSLNTGSTIVKPVINGMHSSRVLIINNGVRLQDQEWGVEHAPNLDINSAEHITVVKGASALKYGGDAIGGTIVVDGSQPIAADSLYGKTILSGASNGRGGSITSNLTQSYKSGWYAKGQGTFKYFGDYEAPDYVLSNTGNREKDFSAGLGLRKFSYGFNVYYSYYNTQIGILRASHVGSVEDLVNALESNTPIVINPFTYNISAPYQDVIHQIAKADFYKRFANLGKLSVLYSFQNNRRKEYDIRRGDDKYKPSMDMVLNTHTLQADLDIDAVKGYKFAVGINAGYQVNTPNPSTGIRRLIPDYQQTNAALYLTGEHQIFDNTILDAGIRYDLTHVDAKKYYQKSRWDERGYNEDFQDIIIGDYDTQWLTNPVFNFHNLSATAGIKTVLKGLTLNANATLASRAPNPSELFSDGLHHSAATIELGDLRMQQEVSKKISFGVKGEHGNLSYHINPYLNFIKNYITLQPTGIEQTTRGAFPVWEYSQVNALFTGVDADVTYKLSQNFDFNSMFAYVYANNSDTKTPIIDIPATNWTNGITFNKKEWSRFNATLKAETVFTQKRYPDNDFETEIATQQGTVTTTVHLSKPPKGYGLLHFNSQVTFNTSEKTDLSVGLNMYNLLNTSYREYLNRLRYYSNDLGRNFNLQITFTY